MTPEMTLEPISSPSSSETALPTPAPSPTLTLIPSPSPSAEPAETSTPAPERARRVLLVTVTEGFRHESIETAVPVIEALATESGQFTVDHIGGEQELATIDAARLADYDVLVFANTSGELPLDEAQKEALLASIRAGKGFIGIHSATDTFYSWPAYGEMIGGVFDSHPWTQEATVIVEDGDHPSTAMLDDSYRITEEFYTFRANPRNGVHVLQRLDAASVGASGDYPLVWCRRYGQGRVYYNALGHFQETWQDNDFQAQLLGALRWAAGLTEDENSEC